VDDGSEPWHPCRTHGGAGQWNSAVKMGKFFRRRRFDSMSWVLRSAACVPSGSTAGRVHVACRDVPFTCPGKAASSSFQTQTRYVRSSSWPRAQVQRRIDVEKIKTFTWSFIHVGFRGIWVDTTHRHLLGINVIRGAA